MTEQIETLRKDAKARASELLTWLTALEPGDIPESFASQVGELKG